MLLACLLACSASGLDFTRYLECACYGESGKNMHCRSKEHVSKFNSKSEKVRSESPFFKHLMNTLGGKDDDKEFSDYLKFKFSKPTRNHSQGLLRREPS